MRLSDDDIAEALGTAKPEKAAPTTKTEATLADLDELDRRFANVVEKHRNPLNGETHQQAADRLLSENPKLYAAHKKARAAIISGQGFRNAPSGGL
jgi:hypothetical protein